MRSQVMRAFHPCTRPFPSTGRRERIVHRSPQTGDKLP